MSIVDILLLIFSNIFVVLFLYQVVYTVVALVKKAPQFVEKKKCKYAFLISAKNEENCIKYLIDSINNQNYPKENFQVFVVADNCDDNTAKVARDAGANVYERFNQEKKGKGYALDYLIKKIRDDVGLDAFDGYLIFDADNLLDENYLLEMNKVFSNGRRIITSYRNSKNYDSNWISSASGMWFLREARHLNKARMLLGVSCMVSGTGYVVHKDIIKKLDGWKYFKLTEDVEFSVDNVLAGEKIAYCGDAVFYDEQPVRFRDSWNQRLRWTKGFYQVLFARAGELLKGMFKKGGMTCYDILMIISPGILFVADILIFAILIAFKTNFVWLDFLQTAGWYALTALIGTIILAIFVATLVSVTEWNKLYCSTGKKILYIFTFPIFMLTYVPLAILALFKNVEWSQIKHPVAISNEDMVARKKK